MKRLHFHSFRQRLNAAFLAVSLAPLLLCSVLLLQIFRFRMTADQQQNAQQQLSSACHALNTMQDGILSAAESLQRDGLVTRALAGAQEDSAKVYSSLYTATAAVRSTARFDLYSADGTLVCELPEHTHTEDCYADDAAQHAQVEKVAALIDALPSAEEVEARLEELLAAEDAEAYDAYCAELARQVEQMFDKAGAMN